MAGRRLTYHRILIGLALFVLTSVRAWAVDVTPPAALTDLFASTGAAGGEIHLSWSAVGDDGGAGDITGGFYRIDYSSDAGHVFNSGTFETQLGTDTSPGNAESFTITNLLGNATFFVRVYTGDEVPNYSAVSNSTYALTRSLPPTSPGHGGNTLSGIGWTWTAGANNEGTEYAAWDDVGSSGWVAEGVSWSAGGKTANTLYTLSVRSRNADGLQSPIASTQAYTSIQTPSGVGFDMVGPSSITARALGTFSNLTSGQSGILLYNQSTGGNSAWAQQETWTSLSLSSNTRYLFYAKARNGDADQTPQTVLSFKYTALEAPPSGDLTLTADTSTQLTIGVKQPPNQATGNTGSEFDNTEGPGGGGSGQMIGTYSFSDSELSPNRRYGYRARYYNAENSPTDYSAARTIYTRAARPLPQACDAAGVMVPRANWLANNNPSGTEYLVEISSDGFSTLVASSRTANNFATFTGLAAATTHTIRVRGVNEEALETIDTQLCAEWSLMNLPVNLGHSGNSLTSVDWTWSAGIDNPAGTEYYASDPQGDSGWVADGASWTSGGKSANTQYQLAVKARNSFGVETTEAIGNVFTSIETPTGVAIDMVGATSVTARALGSFSNVGSANSALMLRNQSAGTDSGWITANSWTSLSLSSNTSYLFRAKARNGDADETSETAPVLQFTLLGTPAPEDLTLTPDTSTQMTVSVKQPPNPTTGASGSEFDNTEGPGATDSGKLASAYVHVDSNLSPNRRYGYRVRLYNADNVATDYGAIAYAYTRASSPTVQGFTGVDENELQGNWLANNNPDGTAYVAELSTDGFSTLVDSSQTANAYAFFTGLTPFTVYEARVKAVNGDGLDTNYTSLGSTRTVSREPRDPTHSVNSLNGITWQWTLGGDNPAGTEYWAEDENGNTGWVADGWRYITFGKTPNTLYNMQVKARPYMVETAWVSTQAYTSIETPTGVGFSGTGVSSVTVTAQGSFSNVLSGYSGIMILNETAGTDSGWIKAVSWASQSLSSNTQYSFRAKARNGDGDETALTLNLTTVTLLGTPPDADLTLTALDSDRMQASVKPPPNPFFGQTGCEFEAVEGPGAFGSGRLTGAYGITESGLSPNRRYGYRVRYFNFSVTPTDYSGVKYLYTFAADPSVAVYDNVGETQVRANWGQNGNPGATLYEVQLSTDDFSTLVDSSQTYNTYALFAGLLSNTSYSAQVRAFNEDAVATGFTNLGSTWTLAVPPLTPGHSGNTVSTVTWTWTLDSANPAGTEYRASDETGDSGWVADAASWEAGSKSANVLYHASIAGRNESGIETASISTEAYTAIEAPADIAFDMVGLSSVTATIQTSLSNLSVAQSGALVYDLTSGTDSGWQQALTWTSVSLASNTAYSFAAKARNGDADETAQSPSFSTYTLLSPPEFSDLTLTPDSSAQMTVTVAAPPNNPVAGLTGSGFECVVGPGCDNSGRLQWQYSFADTGLTANSRYGYRVRWYNGSSVPTEFTAVKYAYTLAAQPGVQNFTGVSRDQLQANWSANGNTAGTEYLVEVTTDAFSTLVSSGRTTNTFIGLTSLLSNTTYAVRVAAYNAENVPSVYADLGSTRTLASAPESPGHSANDTVSISWSWNGGINGPGTEFYAQDDTGNSGWVTDLLAWTSGGKPANAVQTLQVKARNADGVETAPVSTSAYTSIETPTGIAFDGVWIDSVSIRTLGTFTGLAVWNSAIRMSNDTETTDSGWVKAVTWDSQGLSSNTLYDFTSRARNAEQDETPATAVFSTYTLLIVPPASDMSLTPDTSTQLTVSVKPPPNPSAGVTGCEFECVAGGCSGSGRLTGTYSFADTGLTVNTQYSYRVRYFNAQNQATDWSAPASAFTLADEPAALGYTGVTATEIRANWGPATNGGGTEYTAELSTDAFGTLAGSSRTFENFALFSGLTPNTTFVAQANALNSDGVASAFTALGSTRTRAADPGSPAVTGVGGGTVELGWQANGNPGGTVYQAEVSNVSNFGFIAASSVTANVWTRLESLSPLTTYYARVRSRNDAGTWEAFVSAGSTFTASDIGAPAAIADLQASSGPVEGEVRLLWTAPTEDPASGGAVARYLVKWSLNPITTLPEFDAAMDYAQAWSPLAPGGSEDRVLAGFASGTTYYFAVRGEDADLNRGGLSNTTGNDAWAQWDVTAPQDVADLSGTATSSDTVDVQWTAPGDDGASGQATAYDLRYSAIGPLDTLAKFNAAQQYGIPAPQAAPAAELATVSGLYEATTYYFALRTVDDRENWSGLSNLPAAWTSNLNPPGAPQWDAQPVAVASDTATLDWVGNPEVDLGGYYLYRATVSGGPYVKVLTAAVSVTLFDDSGLGVDTTYFYVLSAFDAVTLESGYSTEVSTFVADYIAPEAPVGLKCYLSDTGHYTLEWSQAGHNQDGSSLTDLSGYRIYRAGGAGGSYAFEAFVSSTAALTWTEPSPSGGYFVIRAVDERGLEGEDSMTASPDLAIEARSDDGSARVRVPPSVSDSLYKDSNAYGEDILLTVERRTAEEGGKTLGAYMVDAVTAESQRALGRDFAFSKVRAELSFKVPGLGGAAAGPGDVAVFWHDGVEWVKLGGEVDAGTGLVTVRSLRVGRFQVRRSLRATEFTIMQTVPRKIFTPNADGVNDSIEFFIDNPADSVVSEAKIYDLTGAEVGDMSLGSTGTSYLWDGTDSDGETVPGGVYIYQFKVEKRILNGTVVVAK